MTTGRKRGELLIFDHPLSYERGWVFQSLLHQERVLNQRPDTVILLEHCPVYTLGRTTKPADLPQSEQVLQETGAEVQVVNRGGSITFHGPGQLVVYPLLKVATYATGPRRLVWMLEEVVLRLLARWNIEGYRLAGRPGVWVLSPQLAKIASIGIRIQQGVSLHGCAVNVDMDLSPFALIHPCGITNCRMTTMRLQGAHTVSIAAVKGHVANLFSDVFGLEWATILHPADNHMAPDPVSHVTLFRPKPMEKQYAGT
ncbi:MAG: lipoyl(octanoyl) transferase LipB [Nitrospira sp.]|nr:lipoyl(octanoyl) transferase LipB [Nitrospira sp.]